MTSVSFVDLSHTIHDGMQTYPGLPVPQISDHLSRDAAEELYGPGLTFQIGIVEMCTNTGTYLDVPFHRFADGHDLTGLALERVADVAAVCIDVSAQVAGGELCIDLSESALGSVAGKAVLFHTGHAQHWSTDRYVTDHPYLSASTAKALVAAEAACVGIDSLNIDSTATGARPVHTTLLRADVPIVEHLCHLDRLPATGFRFTAVPPKIVGAGTFTVRAFATIANA